MGPSPDAVTTGAGGRRGGSPWRAAGTVLVVLLTVAGAGMLVAAFNPPRPPQPGAAAAPPPHGTVATHAPTNAPAPAPSAPTQATDPKPGPDASQSPKPESHDAAAAGLTPSSPTGIAIPSIGVDAQVTPLGLQADGQVAVPTADQAHLAGWYRFGPTPGEIGNSVIVGHVDSSKTGPAVFFKLGALIPGATIRVSRADGSVLEFTVDGVKSYQKSVFPTGLVYGPSDQAELRLVTCGGPWSKATSYRDNIIVFATLTSTTTGLPGTS